MNARFSHLRRNILFAAVATGLLTACGPSGNDSAAAVAVEFDDTATCSLDGMLLADYPGPKAQIHYAGRPEPEFFCDTMEMLGIYLEPEQVRPVTGLYVQDMGKADWNQPRGAWIDAKGAWYVVGSARHGSMGPTLASFAQETDAQKFAGTHGGTVLRFNAVTRDMVLDGGAVHDRKM